MITLPDPPLYYAIYDVLADLDDPQPRTRKIMALITENLSATGAEPREAKMVRAALDLARATDADHDWALQAMLRVAGLLDDADDADDAAETDRRVLERNDNARAALHAAALVHSSPNGSSLRALSLAREMFEWLEENTQ
jgi:MoxR-like ATPase